MKHLGRCRCGGDFKWGEALLNTLVGHPDFPGDTGTEPGCTQSRSGPARLVTVLKCNKCGRSITP